MNKKDKNVDVAVSFVKHVLIKTWWNAAVMVDIPILKTYVILFAFAARNIVLIVIYQCIEGVRNIV